MSGGITTSSILQAAIYAIKDGRIEDGLWRLELVMSDLKMAEQAHDERIKDGRSCGTQAAIAKIDGGAA